MQDELDAGRPGGADARSRWTGPPRPRSAPPALGDLPVKQGDAGRLTMPCSLEPAATGKRAALGVARLPTFHNWAVQGTSGSFRSSIGADDLNARDRNLRPPRHPRSATVANPTSGGGRHNRAPATDESLFRHRRHL
ncbi:hypothetical protein GCM10010182_40520 [Actinomadura cremea]|nr:hypothetical protein GCM10010182_40520 [Actinomadura cremea]